jgi:hypothetical protein
MQHLIHIGWSSVHSKRYAWSSTIHEIGHPWELPYRRELTLQEGLTLFVQRLRRWATIRCMENTTPVLLVAVEMILLTNQLCKQTFPYHKTMRCSGAMFIAGAVVSVVVATAIAAGISEPPAPVGRLRNPSSTSTYQSGGALSNMQPPHESILKTLAEGPGRSLMMVVTEHQPEATTNEGKDDAFDAIMELLDALAGSNMMDMSMSMAVTNGPSMSPSSRPTTYGAGSPSTGESNVTVCGYSGGSSSNSTSGEHYSGGSSSNSTSGGNYSGGSSSNSTSDGNYMGASSSNSTSGGNYSGASSSNSTDGSYSGGSSSNTTSGEQYSGGSSSNSTSGGNYSGASSSNSTSGGNYMGASSSNSTDGGYSGGSSSNSTSGEQYSGASSINCTTGGNDSGGSSSNSTIGGNYSGGSSSNSTSLGGSSGSSSGSNTPAPSAAPQQLAVTSLPSPTRL